MKRAQAQPTPQSSSQLPNDAAPAPIEMSPGKAPAQAGAATLAAVAEAAGVSRVAVSVVLNNSRSQVRVSEATRQRILDAARELNYQPNVLARSLMNRHTNIIGFYTVQTRILNPTYPFFGSLLEGLLTGCEAHKKNFLVHGAFATSSEDEIYGELLNGQIDGLVLYARELTPFTRRLAASHLPVVTVADEVPGLPCVTVDDEQGGRLLARYIAEKGHRHVLYWMPSSDSPSSSVELRLQGFRAEAAQHGVEVEIFRPSGSWPFEEDVKAIMAMKNRPTLIAAFGDAVANDVINQLNSLGVRIPEEMAVTGFDGVMGAFGNPTGFTTVRAPWSEVAHTAVSLLVQQCDGNAIPMLTRLPVELVVGETA